MRKKRWIVAAALCLCAVMAVSALAEGAVSALYQAGVGLLFDTENVTITARADFWYNDQYFKHLDASYMQDGFNSQLELALKTPKWDGTLADSGFTVVCNGTTSYAIDPVDNPLVYAASACAQSSAILSSTVLRRTLLRLGGAVAAAAEGSLSPYIQAQPGEGGTAYHIAVKEGQAPDLLNAAGTLVAQLAADRYFYTGYAYRFQSEPLEAYDVPGVELDYADYDATVKTLYRKLYGQEMPENFYDLLWSDGKENAQLAQQYNAVNDLLYDTVVTPLQQKYDHGVALILSDATYRYYDTLDEYYVDNGLQMVDFADFDGAFCDFYRRQTGGELSREELNALLSSNNDALRDAYDALYQKMMDHYMALVKADGKASAIYVNPDGSTRMIYDYEAYRRGYQYDGNTVTRRILYSMEQLELGDTDVTVTLDAQGRPTAAQGTVRLVVVDGLGQRNQLEIVLDATVTDYGTTHVDAFDPQAFGVMSWEEFSKLTPAEKKQPEEAPLPQTLTFDGVQYQLWLEESNS